MISDKLKEVIRGELRLETLELQDTTIAPQVPGWDSLSHVRILCAVEKAYGVRFKTLEVIRLKTVGDLQRLVDKKANS